MGGKDTEQPGVLQIFGIKNCFISFLFVSMSVCPLLYHDCGVVITETRKRHKAELTVENVKETQFEYCVI